MVSSGNVFPFRRRGAAEVDAESPPGDQELLRVFDGNRARLLAFLTLRLGSATEAQDAAQAVFMRLWQRREQLRQDNLSAMMFVAARNYATDVIRARARHHGTIQKDTPEGVSERVGDDAPLPDRILNARQELKLVRFILDELPERCRTAFVRYKFEEASYGEIASDFGVTESMIRKYILRAMAHCAARFAELEGWE